MNEILVIKDLCKCINGNQIISNVDMKIKEGEIYGFLGENGSGKTTIMKLILNIYKLDMGSIEFDNSIIDRHSYKYLKDIGSIIEYPIFYNHLSAVENLKIHCAYENIGFENIDTVLSLVGLINVKEKKVSTFSLGMKQRLGIARALVNKPKLLILDEPINGLDPIGIRDVRDILKKVNKEWNTTILIASHIVAEVEAIADTIGIIKEGRMIETFNIDKLEGSLEEYYINIIKRENNNV